MRKAKKIVEAEIISIGSEIVFGRIANTNQPFLARQLLNYGFCPAWSTVVSDKVEEIIQAIDKALSRSDLVVLTGGLGSTPDDLTREALSKVLKLPLKENLLAVKEIRNRFEGVDEARLKFVLKQALVFEGSELFFSSSGTSPGFILPFKGKIIVALPGVPDEAREIFSKIIPRLDFYFADRSFFYYQVLRTYGLSEAQLCSLLEPFIISSPKVNVGYLPVFGGVDIEVMSAKKSELESLIKKLKNILKDHVYGYDDQTISEVVGKLLIKKKLTISVAESCTAGLLGTEITRPSGSSKYFLGGVIAYSNEIKKSFLKIKPITLESYGSVSEECAREMSQNVKKIFRSDIGLSITGIAGPGGGTKKKPVGLVYLGISAPKFTQVWKKNFSGSRETIRYRAVLEILNSLRLLLKDNLI